MPLTLHTLLIRQFEQHAGRIAIEEHNGKQWSYQDLNDGMKRYAAALAALGIAPGDRIVVQTEKSVETLLLYFAVHYLGAVYVPLNTDYTLAEIGYFISDAQPRLTVFRPESHDSLADLAHQHPGLICMTLGPAHIGTLALLAEQEHPLPAPASRNGDDLAAILYTSGTTGRSKGAMLTHANLIANAMTLVEIWRFTPDDTLIHALPIFHVHGLFVALHCAIFSGASILFQNRFDAQAVIALFPRATVLMGVPTFYTRLLDCPALTKDAASHMRLFIAGSAPLSADTFRAFEGRTGQRVLERYGMTETGMLASNPYEGSRMAGSVGLPLPGVALRIAHSESGQVLPVGEVGIVEAQGPNIFKGYWRNPEKTAAEFRADGYFITGDMGYFDETGYLHLVGRAKDLIISGGLNVYPAEIEAVLDDLPQISEAAVIGVPHPDLGEAVVAMVVLADPAAEPEALRLLLRARLAGFKIPKHIEVLASFPRNAMGKVQKNVLRERFRHLFATSSLSH